MSTDNRRWYTLPAEKVVEYFASDADAGLTNDEAASRLRTDGENDVFPVGRVTLGSCMKKVSFDPLTALLVLVSLLAAFLGNYTLPAVIIPAVALNFFILTASYAKAEQIFADMSENAMPVTTVIRSDSVILVPITSVVPGDIILLRAGQVVPADARLIESDRLTVLETGITANSGSVTKNAEQYDARLRKPHECANMVYAATIVLSGKGRAVVTATGAATVVGRKGRRKAPIAYERPATIRNLGTLSYIIGLALVIATALLTVLNLVIKTVGALDGIISALAFASAFMCESYALLGYLAVAVGMFGSLDRNKRIISGSLIKNTAGLEALKDVTAVMIPCDSVYSEKNIKLDKLYVHGRMLDLNSGELTDEEKDTLSPGEQQTRLSEKRTLLIQALISTGNYSAQRVNIKNQRGDIYTYEENAIISAAFEAGIYNVSLDEKYPIIGHAGTDEAPFETTLISWYGENRIFVRGEVAQLLACCSDYSTGNGGTTAPLTPAAVKSIETVARQMMRQSMRVAAIASGASKYRTLMRISELYRGMVFEGLIGFEEPGLPGAAYNIEKCREAGIKVILLSDKDDEKSRQLAVSLGIIREGGSDLAIGAEEARRMNTEIFRTELPRYRLFCAFNTRERRKIIADLKGRGEKIAYLAGSTEELILGKEASVAATQVISIAKGGSASVSASDADHEGSDALRFSSDVIVSSVGADGSGGFNALVGSVRTAKNIYRNLGSIMKYLIFMNCFRLITVLVSFFIPAAPFFAHPAQMIVSGLIADLAAVFSIIFNRPDKNILYFETGSRLFAVIPVDALSSAIDGAGCAILAICCALLSGLLAGHGASGSALAAQSVVFVSLLLLVPVLAFESKKDTPVFVGELSFAYIDLVLIAVVTSFIVLPLVLPPLGGALGVSFPGFPALAASFIPAAVLLISMEIRKLISYLRSPSYKKEKLRRKDRADGSDGKDRSSGAAG